MLRVDVRSVSLYGAGPAYVCVRATPWTMRGWANTPTGFVHTFFLSNLDAHDPAKMREAAYAILDAIGEPQDTKTAGRVIDVLERMRPAHPGGAPVYG